MITESIIGFGNALPTKLARGSNNGMEDAQIKPIPKISVIWNLFIDISLSNYSGISFQKLVKSVDYWRDSLSAIV